MPFWISSLWGFGFVWDLWFVICDFLPASTRAQRGIRPDPSLRSG
jgi:hypothetical protein